MRHVYRRPFDYSAPRRFYNIWRAINAVEASAGTGTFTTYAAVVSTSTSAVNVSGTSGSRFAYNGVFRKRWNYAQINARIDLFYTDQTTIDSAVANAAFTAYPATVALGVESGASITGVEDVAAFETFDATIVYSRDSTSIIGSGTFFGFTAEISGTYGIGVSRSGPTQTKGVGVYSAGTVRGAGKRQVRSITHAITRSK